MTQEEWNSKRTLTTIYSRVVGWITPIHNWNKGKRSEWVDRKPFKVEDKNN